MKKRFQPCCEKFYKKWWKIYEMFILRADAVVFAGKLILIRRNWYGEVSKILEIFEISTTMGVKKN